MSVRPTLVTRLTLAGRSVARSKSAAVVTADDEFTEIIEWYADMLERTAPPVDLVWEPVKIGPTWRWDNGWDLPRLSLGWRVLGWCGKWLRDKKGNPWQFTPEQTRFILWYFALDESGDFLYHSAVLQRLKGWGKDPVAACLAIAACFAEVSFDHWDGDKPIGREESNAWIQIVAVSQEQTKNTMKLFPSLIPPETRLRYGIQIGKVNVYGLGDTRQIEAVTASPLAIEGGRPTLIVRSETQFWLTSNGGHDMAGAIEGNAAKSEDGAARMLDICNAYRPGEDSVGERVREAWEATQGEDARAMDFGLLYDSLEAPPDAPLSSEAAPDVVASIAGDSTWLDTKPNGRIVKSIINTANPASESRRKWYNQITATEDAWLTPQEFDLIAKKRVVEPGERIFLFGDGSKSDDATAVIGCCLSDGYVFTLGVWQRPPRVDDWIVPKLDVDRRVRDAVEMWNVVGIWFDPSDARDDETGERFWEPVLDSWHEDFGNSLELWAVDKGDFRHSVIWDMRNKRNLGTFTEHAERFVTDVVNESFAHDGTERLRQHVRNARRRPNAFGVGLGKEHRESARKVDAAVCAVGARMMLRLFHARAKSEEAPRSGEVWF